MYDDDDDDQYGDSNSNDLVGQLRAANKAQAKQLKELTVSLETATTSVAALTKTVNAGTVADILKGKGVDPGVSKFLTDVEPTEEAINTWLADNGKLIGYDPTKGSDEATTDKPTVATVTTLSPEMAMLQAAMARVQTAEANAAPGLLSSAAGVDAVARLDQNATSFADAEKGLRDLGIIK